MSTEKITLCERCIVQRADFKCSECEKKFLCINCDTYIHSIPSKVNHKRIQITNIPLTENHNDINDNVYKEGTDILLSSSPIYGTLNQNNNSLNKLNEEDLNWNCISSNSINNIDIKKARTPSSPLGNNNQISLTNQAILNNYNQNIVQNQNQILNNTTPPPSNPNPISINVINQDDTDPNVPPATLPKNKSLGNYLLDKIDYINENEKKSLKLKQENLINEISSVKNKLNETIDNLNKEIETLNIQHKNEIAKLLNEHENIIDLLISNKDDDIYNLKAEIEQIDKECEEEEYINTELMKKIDDCEKIILENKKIYDLNINELEEKIKVREEENEKQEKFYSEKIDEVNEEYEKEKKDIIMEYENSIEELNKFCQENNSKINAKMKEKDDYINETIDKNSKKVSELKNVFVKLKEKVEKKKKGKPDLIKNKEMLSEKLKDNNEEYNNMKNDLEAVENQNKENKSALKGQFNSYKGVADSNTQMHNILFGNIESVKNAGNF